MRSMLLASQRARLHAARAGVGRPGHRVARGGGRALRARRRPAPRRRTGRSRPPGRLRRCSPGRPLCFLAARLGPVGQPARAGTTRGRAHRRRSRLCAGRPARRRRAPLPPAAGAGARRSPDHRGRPGYRSVDVAVRVLARSHRCRRRGGDHAACGGTLRAVRPARRGPRPRAADLARAKTDNAATTGTEAAELVEAARIADASGDARSSWSWRRTRQWTDPIRGRAGRSRWPCRGIGTSARDRDESRGAAAGALPLRYLPVADAARGLHRGVAGRPRERQRERVPRVASRGDARDQRLRGLLLRGDVGTAGALVAAHRRPGFTTYGWPLHMASAELDVLGGRPGSALAAVDEAAALGIANDEMWHWITEIAISALLPQGDPAGACARSEEVGARWTIRRRRADRTAVGADRPGLRRPRGHRPGRRPSRVGGRAGRAGGRWGAFRPHPARVKASAHALTFQAELARLTRQRRRGRLAGGPRPLVSSTAREPRPARLRPTRGRSAGHRPPQGCRGPLGAAYSVGGRRRAPTPNGARASPPRPPHARHRGPREATQVGQAEASAAGLTARERDVLRLLAQGATNTEIGTRLFISGKTASVHVSAILRKLGVRSRVEAAAVAQRRGLLGEDTVDG